MSYVKTYAGIPGWTFVAVEVVGDTTVNIPDWHEREWGTGGNPSPLDRTRN